MNLKKEMKSEMCWFLYRELGAGKTCMCAKSLQSCLPLGEPVDRSPPGSPVLGILQARILGGVATHRSRKGK